MSIHDQTFSNMKKMLKVQKLERGMREKNILQQVMKAINVCVYNTVDAKLVMPHKIKIES